MPSLIASALWGFLGLRIVQRLYYFLKGHVQYWTFGPREAMEGFFSKNKIACSRHKFETRDKVVVKYTKLGRGNKVVLLCNGVGTDLFMWLPLFREMHKAQPDLFDKITLVAPSYRGLFGSDLKSGQGEVSVTMDNCVADLPELLKDLQTNADHGKQFASLSQFDTIMGWSMGAQTAITCLAKHPKLGNKLFLLNPSSGKTLHSVLQSFAPLPEVVGRRVSSVVRYLIVNGLRPLIPGPVWGLLQTVACSFFFRAALEAGSFFGGSPPEQGAYFHRYMKDVFERREQTRGLLDLIVALDSPVPPKGLTLPNTTKIVSGLPDFMTGVYHATQLAESMPNSTHVSFTMGSHFVLIEWPELVALEAIEIINAAR